MGYGVIGSPTDSGSVSLGSSPGTPAQLSSGRVVLEAVTQHVLVPSSSGLGRRPLKAVARVRIPSGLHRKRPTSPDVGRSLFSIMGYAAGAPQPQPPLPWCTSRGNPG